MRRAGWMSLLFVWVGCRGPAPSGDAEAEVSAAPKPATAEAAAPVNEGAAPAPTPPAPTPLAAAPGAQSKSPESAEALDAMARQSDFDRQDTVSLPDGLPRSYTALAPSGPRVKLIEAAVRRGLRLARPAPGERSAMLRWVTTRRGAALEGMVRDALRAGGWLDGEALPPSPIEHPTLGRVAWSMGQPPQRPSWVKFDVADRDPGAPSLEVPRRSFGEPPAWLPATPAGAPVGVEFGHYHGRRPGTVFSELEHFMGAWQTPDPQGLVARLEAAVGEAGYTRDDDSPGLWRRGGASPTTFTTRVVDTGGATVVVVHHQRRWTRPRPDEGTTHDGAPQRPAPGSTR